MDGSTALESGPLPASLESAAPAHPLSSNKDEQLLTKVVPASSWQLINVRELWQYRELLFFLTWRDVKVRYKQTALGAAWAILQPALQMVVFTIFFGRMANVATGNMPYPIFVLAGLLPWNFFQTAISGGGNSVVGSERLITKIYFPRLAVPFAAVGAGIVDFLISCLLLAAMMIFYRLRGAPIHIGAGLLLAPIIFLLIFLAATGVGTLLAALNVNYRDFRYLIPFLVQFWLFATPTVYLQPLANDGIAMRLTLILNPMAGLVAAFRSAVLGSPMPWRHLGLSAICAALIFVGGCLYFRKVEDTFADTI